jgi:hypothetical protein
MASQQLYNWLRNTKRLQIAAAKANTGEKDALNDPDFGGEDSDDTRSVGNPDFGGEDTRLANGPDFGNDDTRSASDLDFGGQNDSPPDPTNANLSSEDNADHLAALQRCLKVSAQKTGKVFYALGGGQVDEDIKTFRCVSAKCACAGHSRLCSMLAQPTDNGERVIEVFKEFNEAITTPFMTAVHRIFSKYLSFCKRNPCLLDNNAPDGITARTPTTPSTVLELRKRSNSTPLDSEASGRELSSLKQPQDVDESVGINQARSKDFSPKQAATGQPPLSTQPQISLRPSTSPIYETEGQDSAAKLSSRQPALAALDEGEGPSVDRRQDHMPVDIPKRSGDELVEPKGRGMRHRMKSRRYGDNYEGH